MRSCAVVRAMAPFHDGVYDNGEPVTYVVYITMSPALAEREFTAEVRTTQNRTPDKNEAFLPLIKNYLEPRTLLSHQ